MNDTNDEIWTLILSRASLDTLIALEQTNKRLRALVNAVDASIVRDRVLERVPWMQLSSRFSSWITCARVIVARRRSQLSQPKKWTFLTADTSNKTMKKITENTNICYDHVTDVSGDSLPESFQPLFPNDVFWQPNGTLRDKYMTINESVLDAVTFDYFKEMPVGEETKETAETWSGFKKSSGGVLECPISKLRLIGQSDFLLVQETEKWLVLRTEEKGKVQGKNSIHYILDKRKAEGGRLDVDAQNAMFSIVEQSLHQYLFQFLPDEKSVFVFQFFDGDKKTQLNYLTLEKESELRLLGTLPTSRNDFWLSPLSTHDVYPKLTTPRDLIVLYEGTLWLNYHERWLVPIWCDVESRDIAVLPNTPTLKLRSTTSITVKEGLRTFRLYRSDRFVTHFLACGRIVCDLQTGKTHIVRDRGWKGYMGASFIGVENELPKFFTFSQKWLAHLEWTWHCHPEDPDFFGEEDEDDEEDTRSFKEKLMEMIVDQVGFQMSHKYTRETNLENLRAVAMEVDDQDEG